ncbi:GNAT family N-acetyltransferase [Flavobacterium psychrophilum]|nr:Acetyltransferase, GNAT family [Flavobacterium psychrophilum]
MPKKLVKNSTYEIQEIKAYNFESIIEIIHESKLIGEELLNIDDAVLFIKSKLERNKAKIYATFQGVNPIGFVVLFVKINPLSVIKYNWHISYLYVKPEHRRNKIAQEMMLKCIDYAKITKAEYLSLNTGTDNFAAHKLYENLGFYRCDFIANYFYYELNLNH